MADYGIRALVDVSQAVADLLRGRMDAKQYRKVILEFTLLRRMDCLRQHESDLGLKAMATEGGSSLAATVSSMAVVSLDGADGALEASGSLGGLLRTVDETSSDVESLLAEALGRFVRGFSTEVADVLDTYGFASTLRGLANAGVLRQVVAWFAELDLGLDVVSEQEMGREYEELVRRLIDAAPETLGEHTSPQDVTGLAARLLLGPDAATLDRESRSITVHDPCCGTGGMLTAVENFLRSMGSPAEVTVFGQENNAESAAMARSARMMRGLDPRGILPGDVLRDDRYQGQTFDYLLSNPPWSVDWRRARDAVRRESEELGPAGRFGTGLPRVSDASWLFVQHMIAHMRPPAEGGARAALLFPTLSLNRAGAGSAESTLRKWLLENDLLEGVVALPSRLFTNTGIPSCLWLLSNRKPLRLRGKVIALDARGYFATLRSPSGRKRHYLTDQHIACLADRYEAAYGTSNESQETDGKAGALLLEIDSFGYQEVTVDQPLRQRFTVHSDTVADAESWRKPKGSTGMDAVVEALRALNGQTWTAWAAFEDAFSKALKDAGLLTELPRGLWRRVRQAVAEAAPEGELQKDEEGRLLPDPGLRHKVRVPLGQEVSEFIDGAIVPESPNVLREQVGIEIGYSLPQAPFLTGGIDTGFGSLSVVARRIASGPPGRRTIKGLPLLSGRELQTAVSAADLTEAPRPRQAVALCTGGDVVGLAGNWRLLPADFGDVVTAMTVLRPIGNIGRALCEWMQTRASEEDGPYPRVDMNSLVPVELIKDSEFNAHLDDLDHGKAALASTTSRILPNVFHGLHAGLDEMRRAAKASAHEARIIEELVQPVRDPVRRAEWTYPYPVAALARQYRIATASAHRKDALLKLAEGVARCVGVLAVAVQIHRDQGFIDTLRRNRTLSQGGATFGTWEKQIEALAKVGPIPELPELEGALDPGGVLGTLRELRGMRNNSSHASRVQPEHKLEREVDVLQPLVVAALESVGWLSALRWELVDTCAYAGNGGFTLIGRRLQGSHPDWEPFERSFPGTLAPGRIYVEGPSSPQALPLWPVARAEVCEDCDARELFLFHKFDRASGDIALRCGRDHRFPRDDS